MTGALDHLAAAAAARIFGPCGSSTEAIWMSSHPAILTLVLPGAIG